MSMAFVGSIMGQTREEDVICWTGSVCVCVAGLVFENETKQGATRMSEATFNREGGCSVEN